MVDDQKFMHDFDKALKIAVRVHAGQKDKGGEYYIFHPIRMAMRFEDPTLRCLAILHDTVEDVDPALRDALMIRIKEALGPQMLNFVLILTRAPKMEYMAYITAVSAFAETRLVKIADLLDNLNPGRERDDWIMPDLKRAQYLTALESLISIQSAQLFDTKYVQKYTEELSLVFNSFPQF